MPNIDNRSGILPPVFWSELAWDSVEDFPDPHVDWDNPAGLLGSIDLGALSVGTRLFIEAIWFGAKLTASGSCEVYIQNASTGGVQFPGAPGVFYCWRGKLGVNDTVGGAIGVLAEVTVAGSPVLELRGFAANGIVNGSDARAGIRAHIILP